MAFDPAPSTWLGAGYTLSTHVVGLTTNDAVTNQILLQLTDALADPTTGDIRDVMMATCEAFFQAYAAIAAPDLPTRMIVARTTSSGPSSTSIRLQYTLSFDIETSAFTVIPE